MIPDAHPPVPEFSVIIPTRDRPQRLARCLQSLTDLDYPAGRFEVIVVDDGSAEPLDQVVAPFKNRLKLRLIRQEGAGPGVARNAGAALARGTFLAFTDDDCTVAPDWLGQFASRFASSPEHLLGGAIVNDLTDNLYAVASHTIIDSAYAFYDPAHGRAHFFATNNLALAASLFRSMEGFHPYWPVVAAEDREFCDRWLRAGHAMSFVPAARIHHAHALTLASFCELHFRYGRGAFHFHRQREGNAGAVRLTPAWRFLTTCFRAPFRRLAAPKAVLVGGLLVIWQLANTAGYFYERLTARPIERHRPHPLACTDLPGSRPRTAVGAEDDVGRLLADPARRRLHPHNRRTASESPVHTSTAAPDDASPAMV